MKRLSLTLSLCIIGALLGLGTGWWIKHSSVDAFKSQPEESQISNNRPGSLSRSQTQSQNLTNFSATRYFHNKKDGPRWLYLLGEMENTTAVDMPELIKSIAQDETAFEISARYWAETDSDHMFKTLKDRAFHQGFDRHAHWLTHILMESWIRKDLSAVIGMYDREKSLPDSFRQGRWDAAAEAMKKDPALGMHLLVKWSLKYNEIDTGNLERWAKQNPRAAAETVLKNPIGYMNGKMMNTIGKQWATTSPQEAIEFAISHPGWGDMSLAYSAMETWSQKDLPAAQAYLTKITDPILKTSLSMAMANTLGQKDPRAVLVWAQENLQGESRALAIAELLIEIGEKDNHQAAVLVGQLDPGTSKDTIVEYLANTKAWKNPGTTLKWVLELPEPATRDRALGKGHWFGKQESREQIFQWLQTPAGADPPPDIVKQAAAYLAGHDPHQAMAWVNSLPSYQQPYAREAALKKWQEIRPAEAAAWQK